MEVKTGACCPKELSGLKKRFKRVGDDWARLSAMVMNEAEVNIFMSASDLGLVKEAAARVDADIADLRLRINNIARIVS